MEAAARKVASTPMLENGRYRIGEVLASGAMGVVHRAYDALREKEVAFKRLRSDVSSSRVRFAAVFRREYDILSRLKHPNIVEAFDYGEDASGTFYTMELLDGHDLMDASAMSFPEACGVLRDIASALGLIHARGLIHRDVSPRNIRLTKGGIAKLIDFGALTSFGRPMEWIGTPPFIAPECLHHDPLDQRTDLYALGALAYWVLTHRTHVDAHTVDELIAAEDAAIVPPSRVVEGLPPGIDELLLSMLQSKRSLRPISAAYVIEQLTTIAGLDPERHERDVAFSYLKHAPLVGREEPLGRCHQALSSMLKGQGGLLFIEAAPGLGRTALLDQVGTDAQLAGAVVLRVQGSSQSSFGSMRELLEQGNRIRHGVANDDEVASSSTHGSEVGAATAVEAFERRLRTAAELRSSLRGLCAVGPIVLLVDDAHHCDSESIDVLASMQNDLGELPILLVVSTLSEAIAGKNASLTKLARNGVIALGPLTEEQYVELLATMFRGVPNAQRLARWLHAQTGGNPARGMDQLRLLLQCHILRYERGSFVFPHDLDSNAVQCAQGSIMRAHLADVSASTRSVAELLSLHEGALSLEQLSEVSELPIGEVVVAADQLQRRGVITTDGELARVAGASVRSELEASMTSERRCEVHSALAQWNQRHRDDSLHSKLVIAKHLLAAGPAFELAGADLIAKLRGEYFIELTMSAPAIPLMERVLEVYRGRGYTEPQCSGLLAALIGACFYGHPQIARQHLAPTMEHLSKLCGFTLARRVAPYVGRRVALVVGLLVGAARSFTIPRRLGPRSLRHRIATFFATASASMAAAASAYDYETQASLLRWLEIATFFPKGTSPALVWEFCSATSELSRGRSLEAEERLKALVQMLSEPVRGLQESVRTQLRLGCIHCLGHAAVDRSSPEALAWADELAAGGPFYAPHAEVIRMVYRTVRGERESAEQHRLRAEEIAFIGGLSWTAASLRAMRMLEFSLATNDPVELVRVVDELDRLTTIAPSLAFYRELGRARLEHMRGSPERCIEQARNLAEEERVRGIVTRLLSVVQSDAFSALGDFTRAREICERAISSSPESARRLVTSMRLPWIQLARAETGLGNVPAAALIIDDRLREAAARDNPLELGLLHAARAEIALAVQDSVSFDQHFHSSGQYFQQIASPSLVQQLDALLARAVSVGMREGPPLPGSSAHEALGDSLDGATFIER